MMKKNKYWVSLIFILLLIVIIALFLGQKVRLKNESDVKIKDNVIVITDETRQELQPIVVTENELIFTVDPQYTKGDVVVAGIINAAPNGFIRKVVETEKEGSQYIVRTEYGVLTDVFEEVHITKSFVLSEIGMQEVTVSDLPMKNVNVEKQEQASNDLMTYLLTHNQYSKSPTFAQLSASRQDYQFSKEFDYDFEEGVSVNGSVEIEVWIELQMDISDGDIEIDFIAYDEFDGELFVGCNASAKKEFVKELLAKQLPNFQFMISIVPVVITNEIEVTVEGEFYVEGEIGTLLELQSRNASGFRYESKTNSVHEIQEREYLSEGIDWGTGTEASGGENVGVFLHLETKLYDSAGFDIAVGIAEEIEGKISATINEMHNGLDYIGLIDMSVHPKLQGNIVVTVPIIDRQLVDAALFDVTLEPFWEYHWNSGEDWEQQLEMQKISKMDATSEWYQVYSKIIDDTKSYQNAPIIFFGEYYHAEGVEIDTEGAGGVSSGYPLDSEELLFLLKDVGTEKDGIPELFIGARWQDGIKILAVYVYDIDGHLAYSEAVCSEYTTEIQLCEDDIVLDKSFSDYKVTWIEKGSVIRSYISDEEASNITVLDSNTLEWKHLDEWGGGKIA